MKSYEADIPQEDGTDRNETVNEVANLKQVPQSTLVHSRLTVHVPQLLGGTKPAQGMRINGVKYQIIRSAIDEASNCYSVHGKKVRLPHSLSLLDMP